MRVVLLFPPHWTPTMPHLALPALTAYLRAAGVETLQRDLNVEVFDRVLSRDYLEGALARLRDDYGPAGRRRPSARPPLDAATVQQALAHGPEVAARLAGALATIRGEGFFDGPRGVEAFLTIAEALQIASLPHHPASLGFSTYLPPLPVDSSRALLRTVRDPASNIFHAIFQQGIIRDLEREQPQLVGISIPSEAQMLAGLTLAHLIKEAGLGCHVVVGGPQISMLREELPRVPALWELFDSAVVFDGEEPLRRLAEALAGAGDLARVPNLIYRDGTAVRTTAPLPPAEIADLPTPDFSGLPLDRYLAPARVLPVASSRGCYHGRCGFCNVGYGAPATYRRLPPERVVEQMRTLAERHSARYFFFTDEALAPHTLRAISALLEGHEPTPKWAGCVRFEKALSGELLQRLARGGCRMLLFGLESASPSLIKRMSKGTQREEMGRILRQSARAGIWNHVFFFFGFPGETMDDAQETVNFLYAHPEDTHSGSSGVFALERYAPVQRHPERYGLRRIMHDPERDLAICYSYEVEGGIDEALAARLDEGLIDVLPEKRFGHFYMHQVYQLLYAGRLRAQGLPLPAWLVEETQP